MEWKERDVDLVFGLVLKQIHPDWSLDFFV